MSLYSQLLLSIAFLSNAAAQQPKGGIADAAAIPTAESSVVATIGQNSVMLSEVREALQKLDLKDQATLGKDSSALNQVVRVLLVQRLMLSEAKAKNWHEKTEVKAAMERARDAALAESYLQSVSAPPEEYPSDTELQQTYDTLRPKLGTPKQWRLAQIYISAPPEVGKEELAKAETKLAALKKALTNKDPDFAKLATEYSDDQVSAAQGGEIGWMAEAGIVADIRTEASLLKAGELSSPIRLKDGWHILKCLDLREAHTPKLEDIKSSLRQRMRDERTNTNSQAFVAKLLQEHPLAINEIALKAAIQKSEK